MDIQLGRLKKNKARGARWEGERLLLFLLGHPAGASAEERESSLWHGTFLDGYDFLSRSGAN